MLRTLSSDDGRELYLRDDQDHGLYLDAEGHESIGQDKEDGDLLVTGLDPHDSAAWLRQASAGLARKGFTIVDIIDWTRGVLALEYTPKSKR
jgi:hypothetical protein